LRIHPILDVLFGNLLLMIFSGVSIGQGV